MQMLDRCARQRSMTMRVRLAVSRARKVRRVTSRSQLRAHVRRPAGLRICRLIWAQMSEKFGSEQMCGPSKGVTVLSEDPSIFKTEPQQRLKGLWATGESLSFTLYYCCMLTQFI